MSSLMRPWVARAACIGEDPEIFFDTDALVMAQARSMCSGCPVAVDCLTTALQNSSVDGIWGGYTEGQRRRIRQEIRSIAPTFGRRHVERWLFGVRGRLTPAARIRRAP
jgi:WhiB family transcriptional regulator, redox-sensing transcriptional regulator